VRAAFRFFWVARVHSGLLLGSLAAMGVVGLGVLAVAPERGVDAAVPVLLLHMFAVSSGFFASARRGHFDLLLTSGAPRRTVALAHWAYSVAPGVAVWLLLGAGELVLGSAPGAVWSTGSLAAAGLVSTLGWAVGVALPRFLGGVVWLAILFAALGAGGASRSLLLAVADGQGAGWTLGVVAVAAPLLFVGVRLAADQVLWVVPALLAGVLSCGWAVRAIVRADIALQAAP